MKIQIIGTAAILAGVLSCSNEPTPSGPSSVANQQGCGNIQGSGNTVNCNTGTPSPTPTPAGALPPCVAQTLPFACANGASTLGPILTAVQSTVPWAPEGLYVSNLVAALNKDPRVCATSGGPLPSDEISIKLRSSNAQSENWDVVNADGTVQAIPAGVSTPKGPANICVPARW